jgi:hypothetical protein
MPDLTEHVTVRFPDNLAAAAGHFADLDGMSMSAWIRRIVDRELAAREGRCGTCGQQIPHQEATDATAAGPGRRRAL